MNISACPVTTDSQGRELISHGTSQFPIAPYRDNLCTNPVGWHWHDEFELVLITDGAATAAADGRRYVLNTGSGCFINSGALHALSPSGDVSNCTFRSLVFHPRLVGGTMDSIFWENYIQPILLAHSQKLVTLDPAQPEQAQILDYITSIWDLCNSAPAFYELEVRHQLSLLMALFSGQINGGEGEVSEKDLRDNERIKQMLQFIQEHFAEDLTLGQVADSAMISESEALRCFHSTIETTPIQYLKDYRLQKAAELLASTRSKISDIASQCGFQEMSYFARSFRQRYGSTPSQYRALQKQH